MSFYVYILANALNSPMYVGSTDDIARRAWEHRERVRPGFASRYWIRRLVWYEVHETRESAFICERQIKEWKRAWKNELVLSMNPDWNDLYLTLN